MLFTKPTIRQSPLRFASAPVLHSCESWPASPIVWLSSGPYGFAADPDSGFTPSNTAITSTIRPKPPPPTATPRPGSPVAPPPAPRTSRIWEGSSFTLRRNLIVLFLSERCCFSPDRVFEPTDAIPAVVVCVEVDAVGAVAVGFTDLVGHHVGEDPSLIGAWAQGHLDRMSGEVVQADERGAAPDVLDGEHVRRTRRDDVPCPPADLGAGLAGSDQTARPAQQGRRIPPLLFDIDVGGGVEAALDHRLYRALGAGEAALVAGRPLHRRADRHPLAQAEVLAHTDLVAVAQYGGAGQREQQAVGQFDAPAVTEHRRQPAPDAAVVQLHRRLRAELAEHPAAQVLVEVSDVELVVVSQEVGPLRPFRQRPSLAQRPRQRPRIARCQ